LSPAGAALLKSVKAAVITKTEGAGDVVIRFAAPLPILKEKVLFIRKRSIDMLTTSLSGLFTETARKQHRALIIGTPGIGKTALALYLLYTLGIQHRRPVVWYFEAEEENRNIFKAIVIRGDHCELHDKFVDQADLVQHADILITDSVVPTQLERASHAIQVSSPNYRNYDTFIKDPSTLTYCLPTWHDAELRAFATECWPHLKHCCVQQAAAVVGGSLREIRRVLNLPQLQPYLTTAHQHAADPAAAMDGEDEVAAAALEQIKLYIGELPNRRIRRFYNGTFTVDKDSDTFLHRLLKYTPGQYPNKVHIAPITDVVQKALATRLDKEYLKELLNLVARAAADTNLRSEGGNAFETLLLASAARCPTLPSPFKAKQLRRNSAPIELPLQQWVFGDLMHFGAIADVTNASGAERKHWVPTIGRFPAIDGLVVTVVQ
jgi:hypothetical protein